MSIDKSRLIELFVYHNIQSKYPVFSGVPLELIVDDIVKIDGRGDLPIFKKMWPSEVNGLIEQSIGPTTPIRTITEEIPVPPIKRPVRPNFRPYFDRAPGDVKEAISFFFPQNEWDNAAAISECESGWNKDAHNTNGEDSRGLFQINVDAHPQFIDEDLFNIWKNTHAAAIVWDDNGRKWNPWYNCAVSLGIIQSSDDVPPKELTLEELQNNLNKKLDEIRNIQSSNNNSSYTLINTRIDEISKLITQTTNATEINLVGSISSSKDALLSFIGSLTNLLDSGLKSTEGWISAIRDTIITNIDNSINTLEGFVTDSKDAIIRKISDSKDILSNLIDDSKSFITEKITDIGSTLGNSIELVNTTIDNSVNSMREAQLQVRDALLGGLSDVIGGLASNIWKEFLKIDVTDDEIANEVMRMVRISNSVQKIISQRGEL